MGNPADRSQPVGRNKRQRIAPQGILEIVGVPYTHSGVLASAMAMQKDLAKVVMHAAGTRAAWWCRAMRPRSAMC
jgi:D-alanine-D-alanine ligase-like ATP-grasp enzyme